MLEAIIGALAAVGGALVGAVTAHALDARSRSRDAHRAALEELRTESVELRGAVAGLGRRLQDAIDRFNAEEGNHR